jgi:imidazolonepropionase-like amidohydrolase
MSGRPAFASACLYSDALLKAATIDGARCAGLEDRVGSARSRRASRRT